MNEAVNVVNKKKANRDNASRLLARFGCCAVVETNGLVQRLLHVTTDKQLPFLRYLRKEASKMKTRAIDMGKLLSMLSACRIGTC